MQLIIILFIFFSFNCYSSPTLYGPTGLIEMPSADSIAYKQFNVSLDYSVNSTEDKNAKSDIFYKFNLGTFENWEIGILGGSFLDEGVYVNLKYFLLSDQGEYPLSFATGIERLGSKSDLTAYLVTSKRFSGGLHGHFGFKAFFQNNLYASAMIGAEYFTDNNVSFIVDVLGEKSHDYVVNAGSRIFIEDEVAIRIYIIDLTKNREIKETIYTFGFSMSKYI